MYRLSREGTRRRRAPRQSRLYGAGPNCGPAHRGADHAPLGIVGYFGMRRPPRLTHRPFRPNANLCTHLRLTTASMEVRHEVTGAARLGLVYELGRPATLEVPRDELETTRGFLSGFRMLMLQAQAGLASALAHGPDHPYVARYPEQPVKGSGHDVMAAAKPYLAPTAMTTVGVGDSAAASHLDALAPVPRLRASSPL